MTKLLNTINGNDIEWIERGTDNFFNYSWFTFKYLNYYIYIGLFYNDKRQSTLKHYIKIYTLENRNFNIIKNSMSYYDTIGKLNEELFVNKAIKVIVNEMLE